MKACAHEEEEKADPEISHPGIIIQSETAKRKQELTLDLNLEEPPQMVHYLFTIYQLFVYNLSAICLQFISYLFTFN